MVAVVLCLRVNEVGGELKIRFELEAALLTGRNVKEKFQGSTSTFRAGAKI